jgi:cytidine deaminase
VTALQETTWEALFSAARAAREKAYAPYSHFAVGAAGILEDGTIVRGCNVENASYGLGVCAERHVVAAAVLAGRPRLAGLALVADAASPVSPCGACRQVLSEVCSPGLPIRSQTLQGEQAEYTLGELLPHAFDAEALRGRAK